MQSTALSEMSKTGSQASRPLLFGLAISLWAILLAWTSALAEPPPGFSDEIAVRFKEGTTVEPPLSALPPSLANWVDSIRPLFTLPKSRLDELRAAGDNLPDLTLWFSITLIEGADAVAFLEELQLAPTVDVAEFLPLPAPPPASTPDFTNDQGYTGPAPDGIDAYFDPTLPGGNGSGVTIYVVDYNWLQSHEDLSKASGVSLLLDAGDSVDPPGYPGCPAPCDSINREHGTATLGVLIADNDGKGVTGISWGSSVGLAPAQTTNHGFKPSNAIILAVDDASPGDVILIESQMSVCGLLLPGEGPGGSWGPPEWEQNVFDAIQTAVANRITVVETAGNGGVYLDNGCSNKFNRTNRDSGAIIVGAGGPPGTNTSTANSSQCVGADASCNRERLAGSTYGSRVDLQGWGANVVTTGYGDHYSNADDPSNPNYFYTGTFGGTSSAAAIVAGAVANLQGIALERFGTPLLPFQVRSLLKETGTAQLPDAIENIGPRPDLEAEVDKISQGKVDLFMLVDLSGSFSEELPVFRTQAPGIISDIRSANPDTRFGIAKFEDYPIDPFGLPNPASGDTAYELLVNLSQGGTPAENTGLVLPAIANLAIESPSDGGDLPQSDLPALYQAATGLGQDLSGSGFPNASIPSGQQADFRDGATKLFLLWTDAEFHLPGDPGDPPAAIPYPGPSFADTVAAIEALDPPMVIGISSGPDGVEDLQRIARATNALAPPGGVDCDMDGAIDIPEGEPLVCEIAPTGEGIAEAVTTVTKAAVAATTPVALCQDSTVPADLAACAAAVVDVDAGSFDPDGAPVTLFQSPAGPYPVGTSAVTLKVTDEAGLADSCVASVTVVDEEPPIPSCNAPATIVPPDVPISFTASVEDNCDAAVEVAEYDCFTFTPQGKRIDKTGSCRVSISGDTITILDSGGVGTQITWTLAASDESVNTAELHCGVDIGRPDQGHP